MGDDGAAEPLPDGMGAAGVIEMAVG
jgi:hypothetical protein